MSRRNPFGTITRSNLEWGSKARKEEDRYRGMRRRGRTESIQDQLDDPDGRDVTTTTAKEIVYE